VGGRGEIGLKSSMPGQPFDTRDAKRTVPPLEKASAGRRSRILRINFDVALLRPLIQHPQRAAGGPRGSESSCFCSLSHSCKSLRPNNWIGMRRNCGCKGIVPDAGRGNALLLAHQQPRQNFRSIAQLAFDPGQRRTMTRVGPSPHAAWFRWEPGARHLAIVTDLPANFSFRQKLSRRAADALCGVPETMAATTSEPGFKIIEHTDAPATQRAL
jgi:hypothetical protein